MAAGDEARERSGQVVRRGLANERPATRSGLDYTEKLQGAEGFADRRTRDLKLLRELTLRRQLVARPQVAFLEETLDLLDDPLIEPAAPDGFDDGQACLPRRSMSRNGPTFVLWSGGQTRRGKSSAAAWEASTRTNGGG